MAHPCIECGSECYCNGDADDVICSKTPKRCEGCGCIEFYEANGRVGDDDDEYGEGDYDDDDDENDDEPAYYYCIGCNYTNNSRFIECPRCGGIGCDEVY